MNKHTFKFPTNLLLSVALTVSLLFTIRWLGNGSDVSLWQLLGYQTDSELAIKAILYFLFLFAILELLQIFRMVKGEEIPIADGILSQTADYSYQEIRKISFLMERRQTQDSFLLPTLIEASCNALLNSKKQVSEALQVLEHQLNGYARELNGQIALINTLANTMIAVGLIGSLLGISGTLFMFSDLAIPEKMTSTLEAITAYLGTAFNTTLLGFFFSGVVKILITQVQKSNVRVLSELEGYVFNNMLSRMGKKVEQS